MGISEKKGYSNARKALQESAGLNSYYSFVRGLLFSPQLQSGPVRAVTKKVLQYSTPETKRHMATPRKGRGHVTNNFSNNLQSLRAYYDIYFRPSFKLF